MFKYVGEIYNIYHNIIENFIDDKDIAIDATLGNGFDTDFLRTKFNKVYAFDIQSCATDEYKKKCYENVEVINDSHSNFKKYIDKPVQAIVYNLGYLPGGDKSITTIKETSIKSMEDGLEMISPGGFMIIACYVGHNQGLEEYRSIREYVENLSKKKYGVLEQKFINRSEKCPILIVIEKK